MSRISDYFQAVAAKRLSATDVDPEVSNGHEFGGVGSLRPVLGDVTAADPRVYLDARFLYLGEDENESLRADGSLTWYDSRAGNPNRSAEYRLYVPGNDVYDTAAPGDLLVIGKRADAPLLVLVVKAGSTYESQIRWLFGLEGDLFGFAVQPEPDTREVGYAEGFILEGLGIEVVDPGDDWLDAILEQFPDGFPTTRRFSTFARSTLDGVSALDNPDSALVEWMTREELLFRTLERHLVSDRIADGFPDVDDFISFSLSVHQRRKSRAGYALENHLAQVFQDHGIRHDRGKATENKSKPDFLFPGIAEYRDDAFPADRLTMLGSKSTCKDRWRQVLSEAQKIDTKHLLTLEPGISEAQTAEMQASSLQLVLPSPLHNTYSADQRGWLYDLQSFIQLVNERQTA